MTDAVLDGFAPAAASHATAASRTTRLSSFRPGDVGVIAAVRADALHGPDAEARLLELGFVEGARVELLHRGLIGGDPIAVRVDDTRVALRRREAAMVTVSR